MRIRKVGGSAAPPGGRQATTDRGKKSRSLVQRKPIAYLKKSNTKKLLNSHFINRKNYRLTKIGGMEASSNLKSPCKSLTKKQEDGRWLELSGKIARDLLKIDFPDFFMEGNDLSDEGYASAMGGPADHWNDEIAIEDKNIWSAGGKTRRTAQWAKKVAGRMYPHRRRQKDRSKPIIPRKKILHVSMRAALTSEAEAEFMNQNVTVQEVGFVVTEENVELAGYIRYLLLYPIVSAAYYNQYQPPLDYYDEPFDVDEALLHAKRFDELYLQAKINSLPQPDYEDNERGLPIDS